MADSKELTIAQEFAILDETIAKLEDAEISLEESFNLYAKGMETLKRANEKIDAVEKQVMVLNEEGKLEPFYEEA